MRTISSFAAAAAFISVTSASVLVDRTPIQNPACTDFTPFTYGGCYVDNGDPNPALVYRATSLDSQNTTIEQCVAFCKGNNWRYAGLEYYGICFCGSSVNGVAALEEECNTPCKANASQACGGDGKISIYQDPTFLPFDEVTLSDYNYTGCYSEGPNGRTLEWANHAIDPAALTVESCLTACKDDGYPFAGVEFGRECWCGVVLANGTEPLDPSSCNMPCTGDISQTCGGPGALNLYVAKDLESWQPCKDGLPVPPVVSTTTTTTSTTSTTSTSTTTTTTTTTTTRTTTTTTATASLCTSYSTSTPAPTCEYKCGKWCSNPLPSYNNQDSCKLAVTQCFLQTASCFLQAGFPEAANCWKFKDWCSKVYSYCGSNCPGSSCSHSKCKSKYPPASPSTTPAPQVTSTVYPCASTTTRTTTRTTTTTTRSTCVPVPTKSSICEQPHNPSKGYTRDDPLGDIELPTLTCNNLYSEYSAGNIFKVYNAPDSKKCSSYGRGSVQQACRKACENQYSACVDVYAQSCKSSRRTKRTGGGRDRDRDDDDYGRGKSKYDQAVKQCKSQLQDCYDVNNNKRSGNRCSSWNNGW